VGVGWFVVEGYAGWGSYGELIGVGLAGEWGLIKLVATRGACGGRGLSLYVSSVRVCVCGCVCVCTYIGMCVCVC
jgi:hypothetical protein